MAKAFVIVGVLISGVLLFLFRYDYSLPAGMRTERFTGRVEFLCGDRWATLEECAGPAANTAAQPRNGTPLPVEALAPPAEPVIRKSAAELAGEMGDKLRCDSLMEKKSKGIKFHLEDDESVPPWQRELFLPEWCVKLLTSP